MKVSVAMITYNHEAYIEKAVSSVLMQRVDFPFELVISDDCSTDRTGEIIRDLAARHPGLIRLLVRERNIGMIANFTDTIRSCIGEYIALVEGDDYWTDPAKLAQQVAWLDANPSYSFCFHSVFVRYESEDREVEDYLHDREEYRTEDIISLAANVPTCSVVFRRATPVVPEWLDRRFSLGDWPLHVHNSLRGPAHYMNKPMGVYRIHSGGVCTRGINISDRENYGDWWISRRVATVRFYEELAKVVPRRFRPTITSSLAFQACELVWHYRKTKNWQAMGHYWWKAARCRRVPRGFKLGFLFRTGILSLLYHVPITRPILRRYAATASPT